jgi:multiple sugar transport system permease protein
MFNNFDIIWILTQGGPSGSTETLPIYAFKITFSELQYGMGSTIAMVMFILLAVGGVAYLGLFNPEQDVEAAN